MMKPDVILIMCDQLRYDCLGFAGHPQVRTPHLDRLAENGIYFENAYCASPVSSPARASWLTGLYPHAHGQLINYRITPSLKGRKGTSMHPKCTTLGDAFNKADYRCGIVGPWHLGDDEHPQHGFEEFWKTYGYQGIGNRDRLIDNFKKEGVKNLYQKNIPEINNDLKRMSYGTCGDPRQQRTTWTIDRGIEFFEQAGGDHRPQFLFLSVKDPHPIIIAPPEIVATYPPEEIALPYSWGDPLEGKPAYQQNELGRLPQNTDPDKFRQMMAHYFALVTHIDDQVGRLLSYLEETEKLDNTLIAFISDHGEMLGQHGFTSKRVLYEGSVKVPCILSWPAALKTPRRVRTPLAGVDLMPTLLDLAGIPLKCQIDGRSLAADLLNEREPQTRPIFSEISTWEALQCSSDNEEELAAQVMARDGDWKYIWNRFDADELYDLGHDPEEMHNHAPEVGQKKRINAMRDIICEMLQVTGPGVYGWCSTVTRVP